MFELLGHEARGCCLLQYQLIENSHHTENAYIPSDSDL